MTDEQKIGEKLNKLLSCIGGLAKRLDAVEQAGADADKRNRADARKRAKADAEAKGKVMSRRSPATATTRTERLTNHGKPPPMQLRI